MDSTYVPTVDQPDVFVSFRAEDSSYSVVDYIHETLRSTGIPTFRDNEEIESGQELKPEIGMSRFSIIEFSNNSANSSLFLRELLLILEQRRKGIHVSIRVYYGGNCIGELIFEPSLSKRTVNNVNPWKADLTDVTDLAGLIVSGYESAFLPKIVDIIYSKPGLNTEGISIGKLFVSSKEIAKGSNGTVVFDGKHDGREVAVKRLVRALHDIVSREIQILIAADQHPNILRLYATEVDRDFFYLALERCDCTLHDLIKNKMYSDSFQLMKPNGYPASILLVLMRDTSAGLAHLHKLKIIHRDLKPHNVLIVKGDRLCVKLADMGISKRLDGDASSLGPHATASGTSGWRAPEQILNGRRHTRAMDVFSLGCVFFFCMTGGSHPFGDKPYERDGNVINDNKVNLSLVEHIPEAGDLCSRMLNPNPELRPKASEVPLHPLFWSFETRMSFMRDSSDLVESKSRKYRFVRNIVRGALQSKASVLFSQSWDVVLNDAFRARMERYRTYSYDMVRDLLRFVRNTISHYGDLPPNIQSLFGSMPEGIDDYFRSKFPKLLMEVYNVMYQHCKHQGWFRRYLET